MRRSTVVCAFIDWLRAYNQSHPPEARLAGFYGLDLYSLYGSIEAVMATWSGWTQRRPRRRVCGA